MRSLTGSLITWSHEPVRVGQSPLGACLWADRSPASFGPVSPANANLRAMLAAACVYVLSVERTCSAVLSLCDFSCVTDNTDMYLNALLLL